jgi:hypothetical protein
MVTSTCSDRPRGRAALATFVAACVLAGAQARADADPIRLRGDALASVESPAGLLSISGRDRFRSWLDAEAVVWFGAGDESEVEVLVISVEARDPKRRGAVRVGRQVVTAGALRPVHVDGVHGRAHLPWRFDAQVFGGIPVIPKFGASGHEWVYGARVSRAVGPAKLGVGWLERRDHGELHTAEVALDAASPIGKQIDVSVGAAYDTVGFGFAEARGAVTWTRRALRVELFGMQRSASHLLPATSLFSVLGDVPSRRAGASVRWRAAPRLDVTATGAARVVDGEVAEDLEAGARLRLDDRGASSIGVELERQGGDGIGWTGVRASGRFALCPAWVIAAEAEVVRPDDDSGRGALWPWGLAAVTWHPTKDWDAAVAVEASASPEVDWRVDALARVSRRWEGP